MDRFQLLQTEEDALREPKIPDAIKRSIYDKIKRLYRNEFRQWIETEKCKVRLPADRLLPMPTQVFVGFAKVTATKEPPMG